MPVAPPAQSEESCCTIGNATCCSVAVASVLPSSVELFCETRFSISNFCHYFLNNFQFFFAERGGGTEIHHVLVGNLVGELCLDRPVNLSGHPPLFCLKEYKTQMSVENLVTKA